MKAMIFAAGLGTRLKPLTDTIPKALVEVNGKPLLEHVILKIKQAGFNKIVINTHHFSEKIIDFLSLNHNFGLDISISDESNQLLETGGGIKKVAHFLRGDKPFLVHNVDILSNVNLNCFYEEAIKTDALVTLLVSERESSRYLFFDENGCLKAWKNEKTGEVKSPYLHVDLSTCKKYAFSGIHVMSPRIFDLIDDTWADSFSIIDFYLSICHQQKIKAYTTENLQLIDVGKIEALEKASLFLK